PVRDRVLGLRPVPPRRGPGHAVLVSAAPPDPEPGAEAAAATARSLPPRDDGGDSRAPGRGVRLPGADPDGLPPHAHRARGGALARAAVASGAGRNPAAPAPALRHAGAARVRSQPVLQSLALRGSAPAAPEPEPGAPAPPMG